MDYSSFSSLFEFFIGLSFAYAGIDSFSKNVIYYISIKNKTFKDLKSKCQNLINELRDNFNDKCISDNIVTDKDKTIFKDNKKKIEQFIEKLDNILDINKRKTELFNIFDKNRFKPLFFLNGYYYLLVLISIGFIRIKQSCNFDSKLIISVSFVCISFICINLWVIFKRRDFNNPHYTSMRKITFSIIIFSFIYLLFTCLQNFCTYSFVNDIDKNYLFSSLFIFLNIFLFSIPFILEIYFINKFIQDNFFNDINEEYNILSTECSIYKNNLDENLEAELKKLKN